MNRISQNKQNAMPTVANLTITSFIALFRSQQSEEFVRQIFCRFQCMNFDCKKWNFVLYWFFRNDVNSTERSVSSQLLILVSKTSLSKMCWQFLSALVGVNDARTESKLTTLQYQSEKPFRNILRIWIVSRKSFAYTAKGICGKEVLWKFVLVIIRFRSRPKCNTHFGSVWS